MWNKNFFSLKNSPILYVETNHQPKQAELTERPLIKLTARPTLKLQDYGYSVGQESV
jgi:hypothetical protein